MNKCPRCGCRVFEEITEGLIKDRDKIGLATDATCGHCGLHIEWKTVRIPLEKKS